MRVRAIKPAIIANGGAGGISFPERRDRGLRKAVQAGYEILKAGGSSLDAVVRAVALLEDDPIFNAGTGSVLGLTGEVEMDASLMTSEGGFGAVAALRTVRHPIEVARLVMEKTDHFLLSGEGALRFARLMGAKPHNPITPERKALWKRTRKGFKSKYFERLKELSGYYGTVGVVARDQEGRLAVGTSTGGISLHLPGRVGDTPILGAGTYCDQNGGVSTTGHGEAIMKTFLALRTVQLLARHPARVAARKAIDYATRNDCRCGLVGIDKKGGILCLDNTKGMSWCWIKDVELRSFGDKRH
jgi:L-asparaginase / beta-aspartyl-peptidase